MILVHPPVVKPCEPPAGVANLAACLKQHHVKCTVIDANIEGIRSLLGPNSLSRDEITNASDRQTRRAYRHLESSLQSLTEWRGYLNMERYKQAVLYIDRMLEVSALRYGVRLSLSNYVDQACTPVRSEDLIKAAEFPDRNPFFPYFKKRFLDLMEKDSSRVVGFSLNYLSQAVCTFAMIGFLRQFYPQLRIILGGGLITSWMRNPAWSNPFKGLVDDCVAGPGEEWLLSMMGMKKTDACVPHDGEHLSREVYLSPGRIFPYSASSGCYWNRCSFCPEKAERNPYQPVPVEKMTSDISRSVVETKPVLVHLLDNAVSPVHLQAIAEHPFGVPWYGFARVSSQLTDPDFCTALKRSGCVMLQIGIESGDQGVLDDMKKGFDLETASTVLKNLKKAGIAAFVYLLFGTPSETLDKARKTLDFTALHREQIHFLNLAIFNLPTYGPEARKLQTGDFYEGDLSLYRSFIHPLGWDRHLVRRFLDREFRRHPAIASILRHTPPIFTSNHAPFFVMKP